MKKLRDLRPYLNIKWKLTLWAAFLILFLFLSFSFLQYMVILKWDLEQEEQSIQKKMEVIAVYLQLEGESGKAIAESEQYLDVLNEEYQLIRIVMENNSPLFTISDEVPQGLIKPKFVNEEELIELSADNDRLLIYRKPFEINGSKFTVEIVRNMDKFNSLISKIITLITLTGIISIVLSLIYGRILSFQLLKPINSIIRTMKNVKENGLTERVPIYSQKDEISDLGTMFNELMDSLEKSFLQQQQFVEDASHELRTPLSVIHGHLSLINRWGKNDPKRLDRSIQLSLNETNRLIQLVSDLLMLTRSKEIQLDMKSFEKVKFKKVIESVIENFKTINPEYKFLSNIKISDEFTLPILKGHLEQILVILLDNAIKYSRDKKLIETNVGIENTNLIIEVKDYGIGIPKQDLPYVLNRFYRVDKARSRKQGSNGLGLSIAKRILDIYDGTIEIDSEYGEWTKVKLCLPVLD